MTGAARSPIKDPCQSGLRRELRRLALCGYQQRDSQIAWSRIATRPSARLRRVAGTDGHDFGFILRAVGVTVVDIYAKQSQVPGRDIDVQGLTRTGMAWPLGSIMRNKANFSIADCGLGTDPRTSRSGPGAPGAAGAFGGANCAKQTQFPPAPAGRARRNQAKKR